MSHFKDRLWSELVRAHGADLAQITHPPARSRARPRILAGTGLGLLAAGTAVAVVLGTAGTTPAFAVTKNSDGSVTVSISRLAGIPQANARLAALGYRAQVVQVTTACGAAAPWATSVHRPPPVPVPGSRVHVGARFDPREIPAGRVLVIPAWRHGGTVSEAQAVRMVPGQVPACLPPPRPVPGVCCPAPRMRPGREVLSGRPGQVLARPGQVLARPCPSMHGLPSRHRQQLIAVHPPTRSQGVGGALGRQVTFSCPPPIRRHSQGQRKPHPHNHR